MKPRLFELFDMEEKDVLIKTRRLWELLYIQVDAYK